MTRVGRTRVAVLLVGSLATPGLLGCGSGSDFKDKPRPPVPLQLSGVITDKDVSVEPNRLGAGPVVILISNLSKQSHSVTIEGGPRNTTETVGPINPLDTGRIQETLERGTYKVTADSDQGAGGSLKPATLHIGPARESSSGTVLLP